MLPLPIYDLRFDVEITQIFFSAVTLFFRIRATKTTPKICVLVEELKIVLSAEEDPRQVSIMDCLFFKNIRLFEEICCCNKLHGVPPSAAATKFTSQFTG